MRDKGCVERMSKTSEHVIVRIGPGGRTRVGRQVVEEYPLRLRINGRKLATLVCSPHQLHFLLTGFLRLQGFAESLAEIQTLGICAESGRAEVRLSRELPENLLPALTSGCGTGIVYNLPQQRLEESRTQARRYLGDCLFRLMRQLTGQAERYRAHGGIHASAIGDENGLLLLAEDIGRHNTLDRLAGEAWFRQLELRGKMLVTSGRISAEMVAKAARLGIGLVASRTSPTDKAIALCKQTGISLVGYLRGESLEIFCNPQQLELSADTHPAAGIVRLKDRQRV